MSDLFKFFDKLNQEQFEYVDQLPEDEVKKLSPFVLLMWMNGAKTNREAHTLLADEYVNDRVFSLQKHPRLLLKLLMASNGGIGNTRFSFEKSITKDQEKLTRKVASFYHVGYDEAKQYIRMLPEEDLEFIKENIE